MERLDPADNRRLGYAYKTSAELASKSLKPLLKLGKIYNK